MVVSPTSADTMTDKDAAGGRDTEPMLAPKDQEETKSSPTEASRKRSDDLLRQHSRSGDDDATGLPDNITGQTKMALSGYSEAVCGTEMDLDENAYGCASVALVRECTAIALELEKGHIKWLTLIRLTCSMGIMVANLLLQFAMIRYISGYVVEPAVRNVQLSYHHFHANVFDKEGNLKQDAWDDYAWKADVCQTPMADPTFYYLIILLWTLRILDELRIMHRFFDEVTQIRGCTLAKHMVVFVDTKDNDCELGGRCLITHLTVWMRWILLLFVFVPRAVIALTLLVLGCRWLSASANFADMVLNALALVFVTDVDEMLYQAVLPIALKKQIEDTNWFFIQEPKTRKQVESSEWNMYARTVMWLVAMFAFMYLYCQHLQTVLPFGLQDVREHCAMYVAQTEVPVCARWSFNGLSKTCYPFGVGGGTFFEK
mmetsp:Transcript_64393/g.168547  ORF Transcript_64393/g.168547 Transcript_64393/m.168547 type:complete len:430 (-) Transcript_64393:170-1459(-)